MSNTSIASDIGEAALIGVLGPLGGVYAGYSGILDAIIARMQNPSSEVDKAYNLAGELSPAQVQAIKHETGDRIARAAGGNADLAAQETEQANREIDAAIEQYGASPTTPAGVFGSVMGAGSGLFSGISGSGSLLVWILLGLGVYAVATR